MFNTEHDPIAEEYREIKEAFNTPTADWYRKGSDSYSFQIGKVNYIVDFDYDAMMFDTKAIDVSIEARINGQPQLGLTGTGNQYEVFATALEIIQDYIKKNTAKFKEGAVLRFSTSFKATKPGLYAKILKRYMPSGWTFETDTFAPTNNMTYIIGPKKNVANFDPKTGEQMFNPYSYASEYKKEADAVERQAREDGF